MKPIQKSGLIIILILFATFSLSSSKVLAKCGDNSHKGHSNISNSNQHSMCEMKGHSDHNNHDQGAHDHSNHDDSVEQPSSVQAVTNKLNEAMTAFHSISEDSQSPLNDSETVKYNELMEDFHNLIIKMEQFNNQLNSKKEN